MERNSIRALNASRSGFANQIITFVELTSCAFELHAELPHTVAFIDEVSALIDHPVQAVRTRQLR